MNESTRDTESTDSAQAPQQDDYREDQGLVHGLRFLYLRRLRLAVYFLVVFTIGSAIYAVVYFRSAESTAGIVGLEFRGIEKHEYPSGRKFSVEDFRSPEILRSALTEAGIAERTAGLKDLAARVLVTPVIPSEIQARWRKQERDGTKREEFYPNEFRISLELRELSDGQRVRLFDAIIRGYQQRVKYEQTAALSFVGSNRASYDELARVYDFWDVPGRFRDTFEALTAELAALIKESAKVPDRQHHLAFREIAADLDAWEATRLQAVEAVTYQGRLVKDKDTVERRLSYRIQDFDIQIRQKSEGIREATRLLEIIEHPKTLVTTGKLANREGVPVVDTDTLAALIKNDYVGPVVERVVRLQEEAEKMAAEKARLQGQLALLSKATNLKADQLPSGYKELVDTLSFEFRRIIDKYNQRLDVYLTATVTSLVSIRQSPIATRGGYSPFLMLSLITFLSVLLAVVLLAVEHILWRVKQLV